MCVSVSGSVWASSLNASHIYEPFFAQAPTPPPRSCDAKLLIKVYDNLLNQCFPSTSPPPQKLFPAVAQLVHCPFPFSHFPLSHGTLDCLNTMRNNNKKFHFYDTNSSQLIAYVTRQILEGMSLISSTNPIPPPPRIHIPIPFAIRICCSKQNCLCFH